MTTVLLFILLSFSLSLLASIYGWFKGKAQKPIADVFNTALKKELENERLTNEEKLASENRKLDQRHCELEKRLADMEEMRQAFSISFVGGRKWLARYIAEADRAGDEAVEKLLNERIYHLPFDQQYDRTKIIPALGECYVRTVSEAESLGFRRAFRHVNF